MIDLSAFQLICAALGATGIGGLAVRVWDRHLGYQSAKRKQTDDVALQMVEELKQLRAVDLQMFAAERAAGEAREALCAANLEVVRHQLSNVEGMFDGLLMTLRYADPANYSIILDEVAERRDARRRQRELERTDLRNTVQSSVSMARELARGFGEPPDGVSVAAG